MAQGRISIVDGIRGHLLIGMMIAHLHIIGAPYIGYAHHIWAIDFWDAEFFVLISGGLCGLLSVRKFGLGSGLRSFLVKRSRLLFLHVVLGQIALFALIKPETLGPGTILNIMLLREGYTLSAILELYLYCFILLFALSLAVRSTATMLALSFLLYGASYFYGEPGVFGYGISTFNVAAWQLVFMIGFVFGRMERQVAGFLSTLSPAVFYGLLAAIALTWLGLRIHAEYPPLGPVPDDWLFPEVRDHLHPLFLLKILLFAASIYLVLSPGRGNPLATGLRLYFSIPLLQRMGQVSLQSFTFHVLLMGVYMRVAGEEGEHPNAPLAFALLAAFLVFPYARTAVLDFASRRSAEAGRSLAGGEAQR